MTEMTETPDRTEMSPDTIQGTSQRPVGGTSLAPIATDTTAVSADDQDRAGIFEHLVKADGDIAGLVAYSLYKQNKLDWLRAFHAALGRAPTEAELTSYIIGEGTLRRLATYRHLAEATLSGHGPSVSEGAIAPSARRRPGTADRRHLSSSLVASVVVIAALVLVGVWLALHFTLTSR